MTVNKSITYKLSGAKAFKILSNKPTKQTIYGKNNTLKLFAYSKCRKNAVSNAMNRVINSTQVYCTLSFSIQNCTI